MAANTHLSIASWNLGLNAALDVLNSGFIEIYDSTGTGQPATPDVAVSTQVKLAKLSLSATAFGAGASGVKTANAITSSAALATGTATWFRAFKSDDTTAVIDGSVGTSGADLNLNDVAITTSGTVAVTSWTVSMPVGQ
jgi:hypothetical protein